MSLCFQHMGGASQPDHQLLLLIHHSLPDMSFTWCQDVMKSVGLSLQASLLYPELESNGQSRGPGTSVHYAEVMLIVSPPQMLCSPRWSLLAHLDRWAQF